MFNVSEFASTRLIRWKTDENLKANRSVRCWDRRRQYSVRSKRNRSTTLLTKELLSSLILMVYPRLSH